jgi:hypothetical protein
MKASFFALVIMLSTGVVATALGKVEACTADRDTTTASAYWPQDSTVKVYFVRDVFTAEEKQTLWKAVEAWAKIARKTSAGVAFVNAGETGGLIDCVGCLTIARQEVHANKSRDSGSFHRLRLDEMGRLISAWIGFANETNNPQTLRSLLLHALESGLRNRRCSKGK